MTTKTKALEKTEIAALMGCKQGSAISRLVALGYTEVCGRCGGGGRYSWNQIDGDKCFGCGGSGKRLAKITAATVAEALARIEAGELAGYFAENKARVEIEAANKALWEAYMGNKISSAYTNACKVTNKIAMERSAAGLEPYGAENDIFTMPAGRAQRLQNDLMDRATTALYDRKNPHAKRIAIIREVHAMVLELNRAWVAFTTKTER